VGPPPPALCGGPGFPGDDGVRLTPKQEAYYQTAGLLAESGIGRP
jgi:hypothetical protein